MSGLNTYNQAFRVQSQLVGLALRQADVQNYLSDAQVAAATTAEDLVADVQGAVVGIGSAPDAQRQSIIAAIREGARLGDLSDARIQAATTVLGLADDTWAEGLPSGYLGPNLLP